VATDLGPVNVNTPRDRDGSFEPKLVGKRHTRLAGLDDKIVALYAGGMTVRDISAHLAELYGVDVGRDTISRVTDAILEDVEAWRTRPLEAVYPIVYFDAMQVRVREDRSVRNLACYLALGVTCDGEREVLGIWWQETDGAKFWPSVLNDLRRRGVCDVLIACVDGLKGLPKRDDEDLALDRIDHTLAHVAGDADIAARTPLVSDQLAPIAVDELRTQVAQVRQQIAHPLNTSPTNSKPPAPPAQRRSAPLPKRVPASRTSSAVGAASGADDARAVTTWNSLSNGNASSSPKAKQPRPRRARRRLHDRSQISPYGSANAGRCATVPLQSRPSCRFSAMSTCAMR
jgi:hypothetical protein